MDSVIQKPSNTKKYTAYGIVALVVAALFAVSIYFIFKYKGECEKKASNANKAPSGNAAAKVSAAAAKAKAALNARDVARTVQGNLMAGGNGVTNGNGAMNGMRRDYADAMVAPAPSQNAAPSSSQNSLNLNVNIPPQPADGSSLHSSSSPDSLSPMDASSRPFVPSADGNTDRDVVPVDPSGYSNISASQLMPSSWRSGADASAQAQGGSNCQAPSNWSSFAPTKGGFDKFIYASRHATMGINTRQPNPTGGVRMDVMRPPVNVSLTGESIAFGDSSYRNDFLSIASQNMITKASMATA